MFALRKLAATHFERDCYNAEAEGFELARILFELGRSEELALVLGGLLDLAGGRPEVVEAVSELSAQLGQTAFAIDALLRSSEIRAYRKDFQGAIVCLKKAQAIDPSRAEFANRIYQLGNSDRARRNRKRSVVRAVAMALGFLLLFVGYGHYSTAAMEEYAEYSLEDFLVTGKFDEGRVYYRAIQWQYPLTIPFLLSFEMLRELEVAERHYAEVEEYRSRMQEDESKGNMRQARIFFEAALNARHTGNYTEAVELLRKVQMLSGGQDPLDSRTAIADLEQYLATARRLKSEATFYRNAGRFEEAHARLIELMAGYSNSPEAGGVGLPVRVTSEPSRARILLNGKPVRIGTENFHVEAETPFVLDLPYDAEMDVTLTFDGYASRTLSVKGTDQPAIHVYLPRRVDQETILPQEVVQPLVRDGSRVFAALASGRVAALSEETLEVEWIRELPELADVAGPPSVVGGMLAVPVSLKKLIMLDPDDGRPLTEISLPGRPVSRAVVSADRVALCTAGGVLATGPVCGSELLTQTLPTPISTGPEALEGGRFVVGCEDGKVWICAPDGSVTSLLNPSRVGGAATALRTFGNSVLMGDSSGVLHHFRLGQSGQVDSIKLFQGRSLRSIDPHGRFVVAGDGENLVRLDLEKLTVDSVAFGGKLSLSPAPGPYVVAATPDGIIHVLDRTTLEERGHFSAQAEISLPGLLTGERALFPASGGKVVGIFFPRR
ncbi:MAG: PQQ-binding-like beta-propeller repeat protein [Planctomycetota bacterium]